MRHKVAVSLLPKRTRMHSRKEADLVRQRSLREALNSRARQGRREVGEHRAIRERLGPQPIIRNVRNS